MKLNMEDIKKLREDTGAGVVDTKNALEATDGDYEKAKALLMEKGLASAAKKADREIKDGLVYSYIHSGGKIGSMVLVGCETDFVAKTDDFKALCHNLALQVTTATYKDVSEFLSDDFIKDPSKKISDLVKETIAKVGENIEVLDFARLSVN